MAHKPRRYIFVIIMIAALFAVAALCACSGKRDEEHVHTYSSDWTTDETYHWHASTCGCGAQEVAGKAEHIFGGYTAAYEGHLYTCSVCGRKKTEPHDYGEPQVTMHTECGGMDIYVYTCKICGERKEEYEYNRDTHEFGEWEKNGTAHKRTCKKCGYEETHTENYYYSSWIKEPTCTEGGEKKLTCLYCSLFTTEPAAPYGHSFSALWLSVDENTHRRTCTRAGCGVYEEEKHSMGGMEYYDILTHRRNCNKCSYYISEEHDWEGDCCNTCGFEPVYATNLSFSAITQNRITVAYAVSGIGGFSGDTLYIPSAYNGKPVTKIDAGAFADNTKLIKVVVPSCVESIGEGAFSGCSSLIELVLPFVGQKPTEASNSYQYPFGYIFGKGQKSGCNVTSQTYYGDSLVTPVTEKFYIPRTLKYVTVRSGRLPLGAFNNCTSIKTLSLSGVTEIARDALFGCSGLEKIKLGASLSSLLPGAFHIADGERRLKTVVLDAQNPHFVMADGCLTEKSTDTLMLATENFVMPADTAAIGAYAFAGMKELGDITFPATLQKIGEGAFFAGGMSSLTLNEGMTEIGDKAFYYCGKISMKGDFPSTLTDIGESAFERCYWEESVDLTAASLKNIGKNAFKCASIDAGGNFGDLLLPANLVNLAQGAFGCTHIKKLKWEAAGATLGGELFGEIDAIEFGNKITSVPANAFAGSLLSSVYIPASIRTIGESAFDGCARLETVVFEAGTATLTIGKRAFGDCKAVAEISLPDRLVTIGEKAFAGCSGIAELVVPDGVTSIGSAAFSGMTGLAELTVPFVGARAALPSGYDVNMKLMGYVFGDEGSGIVVRQTNSQGVTVRFYVPYGLKKIVVTSGDIPANAFEDFRTLESAEIKQGMAVGNKAFKGCIGLKTVKINSGCTLGSDVFSYCSGITSVTLCDGLEGTGSGTFCSCTALEAVEIPAGCSVGYRAFSGCVKLSSVVFKGDSGIGGDAFYGCEALTEIDIPANVTEIGSNAFSGCSALERVSCGGLERLGNYAFYNCGALSGFVIPSTLTYLGSGAFYNCTALPSVTLPEGLTYIGEYAFKNCVLFTELAMPTTVSDYGKEILAGCGALTSVTVPNLTGTLGTLFGTAAYAGGEAVEQKTGSSTVATYYIPAGLKRVNITVGVPSATGVFSGCAMLTDITLPDVASSTLAGYIFYGCTSLTNLTLPSDVKNIYASAFEGCTALTAVDITSGTLTVGKRAFAGCTKLAAINLPSTVTQYNISAFEGCTALTQISVFAGTVNIGENAFKGCTGVHTLNWECPTIPTWVTEEKQLFADCNLVTVNLSGIKAIGGYMFAGCDKIESITLPDTVTSINVCAFLGCTSLKTIVIPSSLTTLYAKAFMGCSSLEAITLPSAITDIKEDTFNGCASLETINHGNLRYIRARAFRDCTSLAAFAVTSNLTELGSEAFAGCTSLVTIDLNGNLTAIGEGAFAGCTALTALTIPDKITAIGEGAFAGCINIASLDIGSGLAEIPVAAFEGNEKMTNLTVPDTVTKIGERAFNNYALLGTVTVGTGVTEVGKRAFGNCPLLLQVYWNATSCTSTIYTTTTEGIFGRSGVRSFTVKSTVRVLPSMLFAELPDIESVVIPEGVERIGSKMFEGSVSLKSVTFPSTLVSMGNRLFKNCTSLENMVLPYVFENSSTMAAEETFYGCTSLKTASFGFTSGTFKVAGKSMFEGCTSLTKVTAYGLTGVLSRAFYGCSELTELELDGGATKYGVGSYAFYGCGKLIFDYGKPTDLKNFLSVGDYAFYGCTNLGGDISVENSAGVHAFEKCAGITSLQLLSLGNQDAVAASEDTLLGGIFGTEQFEGSKPLTQTYASDAYVTFYIPSTLTSVSVSGGRLFYGALSGCGSLNVTIGEYITRFDERAMLGCNISSIIIGQDTRYIADNAFENCQNIVSVEWRSGVCEYAGSAERSAFKDSASAITSLNFGGYIYSTIKVPAYTFYGCYNLSSVAYYENLKYVGENAFAGCNKITTLCLNNEYLDDIGQNAFAGCGAVKEVDIGGAKVNDGNAERTFGSLFGTATYAGAVDVVQNGNHYFIPAALTKLTVRGNIGPHAFENMSRLNDITLTYKCMFIGEYAFAGCSGLGTSANPNNDLKIEDGDSNQYRLTIEQYAFKNCTSLKSLVLPGRTYIMGKAAFSGCGSLVTLSTPFVGSNTISSDNRTKFFGYMFGEETYSGSVLCYQVASPATNATKYAFYLPSGLTNIVFTGSSINNYGLTGCKNIKYITLNSSVTTIGAYAFYDCSGLSTIDFAVKTGWKIGSFTTPSSSDIATGIATPSAAATYYKSYCNYSWTRSA